MEAPTRPTTCDRCGKPFNTSDQHPRRYCSIACEEGRSPLPESNPASPGFHLHLQGQPEALVGSVLVANCLKRTCYSPEWHRGPESYNRGQIVSHDEENEILVYETSEVLGKVVDYENGEYVVEHEDIESGEITTRRFDDSMTVAQIRKDVWWADG